LKEMDNNRLPDLFFNSNQRAINTSKMVWNAVMNMQHAWA
jgi:hypothetical protein